MRRDVTITDVRGRPPRRVRPARAICIVAATMLTALVLAAAARATTTIDTIATWNGVNAVGGLAATPTGLTTFGQTVTVPAAETRLESFTFLLFPARPSGVTVRGELYAWDGRGAVGPNLYESARVTVTVTEAPQELTFSTGGLQLQAGSQYVVFVSISKDFEENVARAEPNPGDPDGPTPVTLSFASNLADVYAGGSYVVLADGGDESRWTTQPWIVPSSPDDVAFRATFSSPLPTSIEQCMHGGWSQYGGFRNQGDCVGFVVSGGKNSPGPDLTSPS